MVQALLLTLVVYPPWSVVVGGDVMLNGISAQRDPFAAVAPFVQEAAWAYANLEIPLTHATTRTSRKSAEDIAARRQFVLRADPDHAEHLRSAGFDVVSLGNNHTMDFGPEGLAEMTRVLKDQGIRYAGAGQSRDEAVAPARLDLEGLARVRVFSMLAFKSRGALWTCWPATEKEPGIAILQFDATINDTARAHLRELVESARSDGGEFVVFALHWGMERQTVPEGYQVALGRAAIEAGADLVLGAHPHVLQGIEIYRGKAIFYSLGNLISPLPSDTALFRIRYVGSRLVGIEGLACHIAGGRVVPMAEPARDALGSRFQDLQQALRARHPHREATQPTLSWVTLSSE